LRSVDIHQNDLEVDDYGLGVVVYTCNPSSAGVEDGRITARSLLGKKKNSVTLSQKTSWRARRTTQAERQPA
jgi:hypothetical protein